MGILREWIQVVTLALDGATRALLVQVGPKPQRKSVRFAGPQTAAVLWAPDAGKALRITQITVVGDAAGTVTVFEDTDTDNKRLVDGSFSANAGIAERYAPYDELAAGAALKITCSAACRVVVRGYPVSLD